MSDMDRDGRLWLMKQLYGMKTIPPAGDYNAFVKAVLICAKGDGALTPEERNWIIGRSACYYTNAEYEVAKNYPADEDLLEVLAQAPTLNESGRRVIIYVAIQACAADREYHPDERAAVSKMAKYLGIEEDVVNQIEEICISEAKMREKRITVMFPGGIPY
ncbi:MAG: hypothetical protein F6J89_08040 [Symploca sp. SIO1C4]|uniref:Co-chaperone DjlA N-terminal domain-containing protein n=1 Tax=Symploca sp. SIO1C4 TaxID=2607765 RepID=A0A6B3N7P7_9CYAN|nr:hypothetical protein [Symploca sp. SIO1C4]